MNLIDVLIANNVDLLSPDAEQRIKDIHSIAKAFGVYGVALCDEEETSPQYAYARRLYNRAQDKLYPVVQEWLSPNIRLVGCLDPRGYPVKLENKAGIYNTFGGREVGFGVDSYRKDLRESLAALENYKSSQLAEQIRSNVNK